MLWGPFSSFFSACVRRHHGPVLVSLVDSTWSTKSKILIPPLCNASVIVENVCRMVHAFTCAGVLPSQYTKVTQFGGLGCVGDAYVRLGMNNFSPTFLCTHMLHCLFTVYQQNGYRQLVNRTVDPSMQAEEVQALPHYSAQGELSVRPIVYIHIELITGYKFLCSSMPSTMYGVSCLTTSQASMAPNLKYSKCIFMCSRLKQVPWWLHLRGPSFMCFTTDQHNVNVMYSTNKTLPYKYIVPGQLFYISFLLYRIIVVV